MSKDVDRSQVLRNIRVRTALKNDGSWIHKSRDEGGQDKPGKVQVEETNLVSARRSSYVMLTTKKFETDSVPSSEVIPSEGDSTNRGNGEVIPSQKDAQPEASTVESRGDTKPQALTDELVQNCTSQPQSPEANTTAENKEENGDPPVVEPNVEPSEGGAEALSKLIQTASPAKENPGAVFPVEPAEQPIVNTTEENKAEHVDTPAEPSKPDHSEVKVSADVNVENSVAEISAVQSTIDSKGTAELPIALKPQEETTTQTEPKDDATKLEDPATEDIIVTATKVVVESFPETSDVTNATPKQEISSQGSVETITNLLVEPASKSPSQPAVVTATEGSSEKCPVEEGTKEVVEAVAEAVVESAPDPPTLINAAPGEEAAVQSSVEPVSDILSELPTQHAAETEVSSEKCPPEDDTKATVEAEAAIESSPETPSVNNATEGEGAPLQNSVDLTLYTLPEPPTQFATETTTEVIREGEVVKETVEAAAEVVAESVPENSSVVNALKQAEADPLDSVQPVIDTPSELPTQNCPPEEDRKDTVGDAAEVVVETLPENPAVNNATPGEVSLLNSEEPVPDTPSECATQSASDPVVKYMECKDESMVLEEPVLKTRTEEVVECQAQCVDNTAVEQSPQPTPQSTADHMVELNIEDAIEPEAAEDVLVDRLIELTDALDEEPRSAETVAKPTEDPKQSHSEEFKPDQQGVDTNCSEVFKPPAEDPKATQARYITRNHNSCSFCGQVINGNVKLTFSEPLISCHPECLKCGVCAVALGDLMVPMFFHDQGIQCGGCFREALKTPNA